MSNHAGRRPMDTVPGAQVNVGRAQAVPLPDYVRLAALIRVGSRVSGHRRRAGGGRVRPGRRLLVHGGTGDRERCRQALRRWLLRTAGQCLPSWLEALAASHGLLLRTRRRASAALALGQLFAAGDHQPQRSAAASTPELVRHVLLHESVPLCTHESLRALLVSRAFSRSGLRLTPPLVASCREAVASMVMVND